jgi:hypothetical protein
MSFRVVNTISAARMLNDRVARFFGMKLRKMINSGGFVSLFVDRRDTGAE